MALVRSPYHVHSLSAIADLLTTLLTHGKVGRTGAGLERERHRRMFEITGDDISALSDDDLRSLVALLCEAEVRRQGLPVSSVTWGGDQNAPDAGVDVRVDVSKKKSIQGFIPRHGSGFQVKKPDLARAGILKEMRLRGKVRPAIRALAQQSGAYIIVSANASVSDSALVKRRQAMIDAVKGMKGAASVALDFYDRGRIATWLRDQRREREVMTLVVTGLLNKQVGFELGISEITVKAHRGKVMQKMKADSLAALVTMTAKLRLALALKD
jgi:DNA-binding CsgD family transcriptional regulator